jgi:hypothetical protein
MHKDRDDTRARSSVTEKDHPLAVRGEPNPSCADLVIPLSSNLPLARVRVQDFNITVCLDRKPASIGGELQGIGWILANGTLEELHGNLHQK